MVAAKNEPLNLLEKCSNEELDPLVQYILKAEWTNELDTDEKFEANKPNHQKFADLIAREVRAFGGNTVRNLIRGEEAP